jgi:hypothetical protein
MDRKAERAGGSKKIKGRKEKEKVQSGAGIARWIIGI